MSPQNVFRQRGMAVIAALLVVVAASALTTSIIERQGLLTGILISEGDRSQAIWTLRGGLDWSRVVLQMEIGRASCRERVCQYVSISVVAVSFKKKGKEQQNNTYTRQNPSTIASHHNNLTITTK